MAINYIRGDLFTTPAKLIVHGCNAQGVMGSGVARIVRDNYSDAYKHYMHEYNKNGLQLGQVIFVPCGNKIIANAITQFYFGNAQGVRYANYEAIAVAMETINKYCEKEKIPEIAMPKLGAGLARGDWGVIAAIIESEAKFPKVNVYVI